MSRVRIGAVSFLNTRPLVHGLQSCAEYALSFDTPGNLAERLRLGEIDAGLIPLVEHLRGTAESYVPGIGIASDGAVRTVKLYSRVPFDAIRDVAVDGRSRTSVALLRILLSEKYGVTPDFYSHRVDLREMLRSHEAALVIGDAAFPDEGAPYLWDLGQGWRDLTGLPFVYAVWAVNEGVDRAWLAGLLRDSLAAGLSHLEDIAVQSSGVVPGEDATSILRYFRDNLHYVLGDRDVQGIQTFQRLCQQYNLIPASAAPRTLAAAHS